MHRHDDPHRTNEDRRSGETKRQRGGPPPTGLTELQQTAGNAAVARLVARSRAERSRAAEQDGPSVPAVLAGVGRPLAGPVRDEMEARLGADFSDVRVHTGQDAQRSAADLGARAYTSGNHVVIGEGGADRHTLAHELTHVLQQRAGRVDGTDDGTGLRVSDPADRFERAAEANATRALSGPVPDATTAQRAVDGPATAGTVQRADADVAIAPAAEQPTIAQAAPTFAAWLAETGPDTPERIEEIRALLDRRILAGPPFDNAELVAIQQADDARLTAVGMGGYQSAADYLTAPEHFRNWLSQSTGRRLLIASIAWRAPGTNAELRKSPAYTLGRALAIRDPRGLTAAEAQANRTERDDQIRGAFVNTLNPPSPPEGPNSATGRKVARATDILTRVFLILQNGLKVYDPAQGRHVDYRDGDVARALAHGGRVTIRIPQLGVGERPDELLRWLGLANRWGFTHSSERRLFSSHRMEIGQNTERQPGTGTFDELGGNRAKIRNALTMLSPRNRNRMFGINLAADGWGNHDFNGDTITPDGGHGHLYLGFQAPRSDRDGALQVGMETTAPKNPLQPWAPNPSPVGYVHDARSTEATANPETSFYGHKQDKIGGGRLADNQRLVNLQEFATEQGGWRDFLRRLQERWEQRLRSPDQDRGALYAELVGRRGTGFQPTPRDAGQA